MELYEKPGMEVVSFNNAFSTSASCEGYYECDTELPPICFMGDDGEVDE